MHAQCARRVLCEQRASKITGILSVIAFGKGISNLLEMGIVTISHARAGSNRLISFSELPLLAVDVS